MTKRILFLIAVAAFLIAATLFAQGGQGPQNREAPVTNVTFDRLLKADPQNWLTYGGALTSQRHSGLTQITRNVKRVGARHGTAIKHERIGATASPTPRGGDPRAASGSTAYSSRSRACSRSRAPCR